MSSILGITVIYETELNKFIENIKRYIEYIDILLIWQNSKLTDLEKEEVIKKCYNNKKIYFVGDGTNKGLDYAYNYALQIAYENNFDWLLTMDQDSTWYNFHEYIKCINNFSFYDAIFGPKVINKFDVNQPDLVDENNEDIVETNFVISSGALYPVKKIYNIGGFSYNYFIDAIDEEICYRSRFNGIKTYIINRAHLEQEFGEYCIKHFFSKKIACSNYSPFRYYHIVRNHIWLLKSGFLEINEKKLIIHNYLIAPFFKVLLGEGNKLKKISAILHGFKDGFLNNCNCRGEK